MSNTLTFRLYVGEDQKNSVVLARFEGIIARRLAEKYILPYKGENYKYDLNSDDIENILESIDKEIDRYKASNDRIDGEIAALIEPGFKSVEDFLKAYDEIVIRYNNDKLSNDTMVEMYENVEDVLCTIRDMLEYSENAETPFVVKYENC